MITLTEIQSVGAWATNAELICDVAALGWLPEGDSVLDCTYGLGKFWTKYRPSGLIGSDMNPEKAPDVVANFTMLPFDHASVDVVVFDPDYKLSGTPALGSFDARYGTDVAKTPVERLRGITEGAHEAARVARKHLLVKCQDQVVSGEMCWQSAEVTQAIVAEGRPGWRLAERFDFPGKGIPQPGGRRQLHARHSYSQLLVFTRLRRDAR